MKKIIAILFLSVYLLAVTRLNELLKLSVLVEHFNETEKNGSTVTFFQFLKMHYLTDDLNDKDNDRDMQLPFKSNDIYISGNDGIDIPVSSIPALAAHNFIVNENCILIHSTDSLTLPDYHIMVWHPPKYV